MTIRDALEGVKAGTDIVEDDPNNPKWGGSHLPANTAEHAQLMWTELKGLECGAHLPPLNIPQAFKDRTKPFVDLHSGMYGYVLGGHTFPFKDFWKDVGFLWRNPQTGELEKDKERKKLNKYWQPAGNVFYEELKLDIKNLITPFGYELQLNGSPQ